MFNARRHGGAQEIRDASGFHNPFESPSVPLSSVGLDSVFGKIRSSAAGEDVTADTATGLPTFWRCLCLMGMVIAGCPLRTYEDPGQVEQSPKLFRKSNTTMMYTQYALWELVVFHLGLWGNAYVFKLRDPMGRVLDLRPIGPERVDVKIATKPGVTDDNVGRKGRGVKYDQGDKIFSVERVKSDGSPDNSKEPMLWSEWQIMHIAGPGYNGLYGLSPIQLFQSTLGTSIAADKLAAKFYAKGTMLTGVINVKAPLSSQEQADELRRRWIQKNGGLNATAEVAVLDAETSFTPLTIPPDSLQFLESRRWQTTEIAKMFGIPPHLVGDVEKSTSWGTGIEQQNIAFIDYTIGGWTNRIEQVATRELISNPNWYCEFDLDKLARGDLGERMQAYATGVQWGILTRNECRRAENRKPIKGLDQPLVPMNMQTGNPNDVLGDPSAGTNPTEGGNSSSDKGSNTNSNDAQQNGKPAAKGQNGSNSTSAGASKPSTNPNTKG